MTTTPPAPPLLTAAAAQTMSAADQMIQFVVHPALLPDLQRWLAGRGLGMGRIPVSDEDDLPTYCTTPLHELRDGR